MRKHCLFIAILVVCGTLIAGNSLASPLTDFSAGKTSVDIGWYPNLQMTDQYTVGDPAISRTDSAIGKNGNWAWGVTTGLGGKWAVQFRQFNTTSEAVYWGPQQQNFGIRSQEFNALYKIDKNLSAFAGWHQAHFSFWASSVAGFPDPNLTGGTKNVFQAGLVGTAKIAPKTQLYGIVGVGKDLFNCEVGVSYEVVKNLEFTVMYRYKKVSGINETSYAENYRDSVTAKGLGYGITYKF